jgi:hypothetical protein
MVISPSSTNSSKRSNPMESAAIRMSSSFSSKEM